ncbi:MAG: PAS domain S-box protein [Polyangiaceae bacterium]|nr:PAS domain S-box protein [Polyangiaceae bacterium]
MTEGTVSLLDLVQSMPSFFEASPDGVVLHDHEGQVLFANEALCKIVGISRESIVGQSMFGLVRQLTPPNEAEVLAEKTRTRASGKPVPTFEIEYRGKWLEISTPLQDPNCGCAVALVRDVTDRKLAEELLTVERDLGVALGAAPALRDALEAALDGVLRMRGIDAGGVYLVDRATGAVDLVVHRGLSDAFIRRVSHFAADAPQARLVQSGTPVYARLGEITGLQEDAHALEGLRSLAVIPIVHAGEVIAVFNMASHQHESMPEGTRRALETVAVQVGEALARFSAERAHREIERWYRALVEAIPDMVFILDREGTVRFINRSAAAMLGRTPEDILDKKQADFFPKEASRHGASVAEVFASGRMKVSENLYYDLPSGPLWLDNRLIPLKNDQGETTHVLGISRDVTERRRIEAGLQNAQKLESLGVLAGGIAHDFNNLLTAQFGYLELASSSVHPDSEAHAFLREALSVFGRTRDLTQQLITFAKGGHPRTRTADLEPLLRATVRFSLSGANVSPAFALARDLWLCDIDGNQIRQVFDNITINARQAMPVGGTLSVSAVNVPENAPLPPSLRPGRYVRVSFTDHGTGVAEAMLPRIFDPFFTTKEQGSGLGLAVAYSIVKKHGGHIDVESELGRGTTFHVYLPASPHDRPEPTVARQVAHRGSGRVLLVEDEEAVRAVTERMLVRMGYDVLSASNGAEAIERFRQEHACGRTFDVAIIDLTMPGGMDGVELVSELSKIEPSVRAIAATGYSEHQVVAHPDRYGFVSVLLKPFASDELGRALQQVTDRPHVASSDECPV